MVLVVSYEKNFGLVVDLETLFIYFFLKVGSTLRSVEPVVRLELMTLRSRAIA